MFLHHASKGIGAMPASPSNQVVKHPGRVMTDGKFFRLDGEKWFLKGMTYGPFAPNAGGAFLPERSRMLTDFAHMRALGVNCLRVYHIPAVSVLDDALSHGLRVFLDVPWDKHRCFFEDWSAMKEAQDRVRLAARVQGRHPALFAISVVNEIPSDVVRFYGYRRVARFVDDLMDIAKQEAPECLTTFANYPSTEFLRPERGDFLCFNVYLDDGDALGAYLDRLQHSAGSRPLILGEFGRDSLRSSEESQARAISEHVEKVSTHGLAGSFVFSYTDDWFTGGHQVEDWAFGVTRKDRSEKPSAVALREAWMRAPRFRDAQMPRVSVVVCSYNGAATTRECLTSLSKLDYPAYEIVFVNDGSTDNTREILADFPQVRCYHQENMGLSVARNVGAKAATGEIVAYTDSDCVADPDWLYYLVDAMQRQGVEAIGGPNLPPPTDSWTAQCVAASPGGPSHVLLDDRDAEHVPGCNMAFRRSTLLALGGFDAQFRQAGDDVDICWRFLDAGYRIGFAAAAMVWHHRRNTIKAFLKQQKGYGRSEGMLIAKHRNRFNSLGCSQWRGIIYGEGAVGLPVRKPAVFHGRYGSGLFQTIYHRNEYSARAYFTLLEWHGIAAFLLGLAFFWPGLAVISGLMWMATLVVALRATINSPLSKSAPLRYKATVFALHLMQPVVRAWHRYHYRLTRRCLPPLVVGKGQPAVVLKRTGFSARDAYWLSEKGIGREELLEAIEAEASEAKWHGNFQEEWQPWDIKLNCDYWHTLMFYSATEKLGSQKCFTRVRCRLALTRFAEAVVWTAAIGALAVAASLHWRSALVALAVIGLLKVRMWFSRRLCFSAAAGLLYRAGNRAGLDTYSAAGPEISKKQHNTASSEVPPSHEFVLEPTA